MTYSEVMGRASGERDARGQQSRGGKNEVSLAMLSLEWGFSVRNAIEAFI